jgi:uncharacterized protein (DUF2141 family)
MLKYQVYFRKSIKELLAVHLPNLQIIALFLPLVAKKWYSLSIQVQSYEGFENTNGTAKIALVNSKENYSGGTPFKGYTIGITGNRIVKTLVLLYGEYAVKVFHDENGNGELDKGILGIPEEAYGFSNDARGSMGPPEYEKAAFRLDSPEKELVIHIK